MLCTTGLGIDLVWLLILSMIHQTQEHFSRCVPESIIWIMTREISTVFIYQCLPGVYPATTRRISAVFTQKIHPILVRCWNDVVDGGLTLNQQ